MHPATAEALVHVVTRGGTIVFVFPDVETARAAFAESERMALAGVPFLQALQQLERAFRAATPALHDTTEDLQALVAQLQAETVRSRPLLRRSAPRRHRHDPTPPLPRAAVQGHAGPPPRRARSRL